MKYLITLFFLLFLFCPAANAQNLKDNGELWAVMSDTEKNLYIKGFNDGFFEGSYSLDILVMDKIIEANSGSLSKEEKNSLKRKLINYATNTISSNKEINAQPEAITNEQMINQMNVFYKDPQNKKIPLLMMRRFSLYKLQGQDVSDSILEARKAMNDLLQLK